MRAAIDALLDRVTRLRGVRAVVLVSESDGLPVASSAREGEDIASLAALASSLVARLRRTADAAGAGVPRFVHLRAADGLLCAAPAAADLLLVALTDGTANLGLVRLALLESAGEAR